MSSTLECKDNLWKLAAENMILPSVCEYAQMSLVSCLKRDLIFFQHSFHGDHDDMLLFLASRVFMERSAVSDLDSRLILLTSIIKRVKINDGREELYHTIVDVFKRLFTGDLVDRISECMKVLSAAVQRKCCYHTPRLVFSSVVFDVAFVAAIRRLQHKMLFYQSTLRL